MTDIGELVVRIKADAAQLERELKNVGSLTEQTTKKMGTSFGSLRGQIATLAAALAGGQLVGAITTFEKLEASLRTVTGSAKEAESAFAFIQEFAATTPFQLEEVAAAFIKLTSLGLDPSADSLRSYGNTASAMGKSLNQVIEAVADATTGEFERLKEFGIRARQQGDNVTFTFQGVSTTVGKSAGEIENYIRRIGDVNFAGAMEEQADTLNVALSNMGDSFSRLAKAIGEAGVTSIIMDVAHGITFAADKVSAFTKAIRELQAIVAKDESKRNAADKGFYGKPLDLGTVSETRPDSVNLAVFMGNEQYGPSTSKPTQGVPSGSPGKASDNIKKAREALEDYNRSLEQEGILIKLSERDRTAQEARFRTEEIARRGGITLTKEQIEANEGLALSNYDVAKSNEEMSKSMQEAARFQQILHDKLSQTLTDIAFKAGSASEAMLAFAESIAKAAFEKSVAGPLADAFIGTGGKSGILDGAISGIGSLFGGFGGFFAEGGNPPPGVPYVVGEKGPELRIDGPGTIIPNNKIGSQTTVIVQQTIQVNPGVPELINARISEAAPFIASQAQAAVFAAMQQGGPASRITQLRS